MSVTQQLDAEEGQDYQTSGDQSVHYEILQYFWILLK